MIMPFDFSKEETAKKKNLKKKEEEENLELFYLFR